MISRNKMKWELGHVYDVTEYVNKLVENGELIGLQGSDGNIYKHGYYLCHDTWDTHIYRIQIGVNSEYEEEPRTKIIETENVSHEDLVEFCIDKFELNEDEFNLDPRDMVHSLIRKIGLKEVLKALVEFDYENGYQSYYVDEFRYDEPLETLVEVIDGGYGISQIDL